MSCRTSILDGLDVATLQARLTEMQLAYLDLTSGAKAQTVSYSQADGGRSVSYTMANLADLTAAILTVQTQIDQLQGGTAPPRRRPRSYYGGCR